MIPTVASCLPAKRGYFNSSDRDCKDYSYRNISQFTQALGTKGYMLGEKQPTRFKD